MSQPVLILSIALGGAVGAVSRYGVSVKMTQWFGHGFPYGTLAVNILGSLLLGIMAELLARSWDPSPELRDALRVGFLGAFTTFSTFSLDIYTLVLERHEYLAGALYVVGSLVLGVGALIGGLMLARLFLP
ncbi:fluoride efflux transporter CrcB [Magnetospira sp. QH-2]|uniref:fluoride efflux transporter CrcB n=1 Tax=Magnetospira sp. (strain QH-2) TaxID=1288970 RepID=UPI0005FA108C|nr:fluoride efflux transporter CrcB [Magnetospira sp. QH-2]